MIADQKQKYILLALCIFASLLWMWGGTPYYHPDWLLWRAKYIVANYGNPDFFNYPGLVLYLITLLYSLIYGTLEIIKTILPKEWFYLFYTWPIKDIPGHLLIVFFGLICIVSVYFITFLLTKSNFYATISCITLITCPIWNENFHFITVDPPLAALTITTTAFTLYSISKKIYNFKWLFFNGILVGLTASAKYNGGIILIPVIFALYYQARHKKPFIEIVFPIILGSIVSFFLTNPFIILNFKKFLSDFLSEVHHAKVGHWGATKNSWHYFLTNSLYFTINPVILILSLLGMFTIFFSPTRKEIKILIILFPFLHFLILAKTKLAFHRYTLPLIPYLSIYFSYFLYYLKQKTQRLIYYPILIIAILAVLYNLKTSLQYNIILSKPDTRYILKEIFKPESGKYKILLGSYISDFTKGIQTTMPISIKSYFNRTKYSCSDYNLIIFDSLTHDRFIYDKNSPHLLLDFSNCQCYLITINPFKKDKKTENIPHKNNPISYKEKVIPGPYIEIYVTSSDWNQKILNRIKALSKDLSKYIEKLPCENGIYYQYFAKR